MRAVPLCLFLEPNVCNHVVACLSFHSGEMPFFGLTLPLANFSQLRYDRHLVLDQEKAETAPPALGVR